MQYGDGLFGPIIINGPATADYDEDLGVLALSDWGHKSVFESWETVQATALPVTLENGLINGTNTYGNGGSRYETVFKPGKKYRIRILNAGVEAHFRFAIDGHTFTVIANDMVPLKPYKTDNVRRLSTSEDAPFSLIKRPGYSLNGAAIRSYRRSQDGSNS